MRKISQEVISKFLHSVLIKIELTFTFQCSALTDTSHTRFHFHTDMQTINKVHALRRKRGTVRYFSSTEKWHFNHISKR